ncbi:MAG: tRNA (guanosine(37)-N1)-methyltransferase TrmD [Bdellovibrio sp. CG10_big_fil_rev_8_21_14_0_10_47_8]|nr:MAG: tRNA (guanosine(37)-N1)-methyltransferase TrmD [Bdellovibrio sp. CG10_big_fil_rev_8_21_14_0_10_47_8]
MSTGFQVITLLPAIIEAALDHGILSQARERDLIRVETVNPRDFTKDVHHTVDDRPFGGGDGMVMMVEPLQKALAKAMESAPEAWVVYLSPQGASLRQDKVMALAEKKNIVLICGRYAGVDQRFLNEWVDEELSIGDYVLSGGELAAAVVIDAVSRQIPGVLGHQSSAQLDSFSEGLDGLLEAPSYTRPQEILGQSVPEILLSGNHQKISEWKKNISLLLTLHKRPDLLAKTHLNQKELQSLRTFWSQISPQDRRVLGLEALTDDRVNCLEPYGT